VKKEMNLRESRGKVTKGGRGCGLQRDSGRATRLEEARDREVISETEENFSGAVAAKMETGDFRALARGESAMCGGNDDVAQDGNEDNSGNGLPVVKTGSPPTKARYCSMVSFGGVDTEKSNIQRV